MQNTYFVSEKFAKSDFELLIAYYKIAGFKACVIKKLIQLYKIIEVLYNELADTLIFKREVKGEAELHLLALDFVLMGTNA